MPPRSLLLAALVPSLAATAVVLVAAVSHVTPPRNLAEAAARGSASYVLRFLRAGESATRLQPVDPEVISSAVTRVTPLEAAVWSRQAALIELLDRQGVIPDAPSRQHMTCLAADLAVEDAVDYLGKGEPVSCPAGETLAGIVERSR